MTTSLVIQGTYRGELLMDELLAAFPAWVVGAGDARRCLLQLDAWPDRVRVEFPAETAPAAVLAVVQAHNPNAESGGDRLRRRVRLAAQGAVGKTIDTLTAAEVRALLAVLLWREGAINGDGTVRPLGEWT